MGVKQSSAPGDERAPARSVERARFGKTGKNRPRRSVRILRMIAAQTSRLTVLSWLACLLAGCTHTLVSEPSPADQETIGTITIERKNVFDTSLPEENKSIFRLANRLHIKTREAVLRKQLLVQEGDPYDARKIEESGRLLRQNAYLFDATIETVPGTDGKRDLKVTTRDVWTLAPDASVSRSGGENTLDFSIEELNLLGTGSKLSLSRTEDVDRDSNVVQFANRHLGRHWLSLDLRYANSSDGDTSYVDFARPFYALDIRRAGGITLLDDERVESVYELGERVAAYRKEQSFLNLYGGWSRGLHDGWVSRWSVGFTYDDAEFSEPGTPGLPLLRPDDRKLVYPFVAYERLQDKFSTTSNLDSIEKTEDIYLGTRFSGRLGWASPGLGSDRGALIYAGSLDLGFGKPSDRMLLLSSRVDGRLEDGDLQNLLVSLDARHYRRQSDKRAFFITLSGAASSELDLDNPLELGGDSGLRGYPLRYQRGESRLLLTLEQRYYTDWYPFRLLRVGGAVFADVGRTWGRNPAGADSAGWLKDVGIGLRLVPTRGSSDKVFHIDLAFPLDGDDSIDNVQLLLEGKRGF